MRGVPALLALIAGLGAAWVAGLGTAFGAAPGAGLGSSFGAAQGSGPVPSVGARLATGPARARDVALELDVALDPASRQFRATARVRPAVRDFHFRLHESLAVSAASIDGQPVRVDPGPRAGGLRRWRVRMPSIDAALRVEYGGTLPALDRTLDHRGVLRALPPMASSAGSYLPANGGWYPRPGPLFGYRVTVSVPADQRALVPGDLQSEALPAGPTAHYRASFEFAHPADGIDLFAGPWVIRERLVDRVDEGRLRLRTYFFRDLDAIDGLADGYLEDTRRYVALYSELIGAYPFGSFSVVASPLPTGFGMPTLTWIGAEVLKLPFIRATSLGHEVLHNWWGNGVYVDPAQGNWSEGLTTFMADYAYRERESPAAARAMRLGWLRDLAAVPEAGRQPLRAFRARTHGAAAAVGYGQAAMLFLMLRDAIGEDAFRRGVAGFWDSHRFRAATWDDLRAAFERASGRALRPFFEQWLARPGAPRIAITGARMRAGPDGHRLELALEQSAPAYALRLPVEIVFAGRSEVRWIETDRQREHVSLAVDRQPESVRLDPEVRVWRLLERDELPPILRQWIVAEAPRLVHASTSPEVRDAATALAQRLFEVAPTLAAAEALRRGRAPVLLAGLHDEVDAALSRAGWPARPKEVAGRGSAAVWTVGDIGDSGPPVAVVSARDAGALRALLRPLPHYGGQSWVVFDGARAIDRGIWPAPGRTIPVSDVPTGR